MNVSVRIVLYLAPINKVNATYPHRLLWFIRLVLVSLLHVHRREKKFSRVRVDRTLHQLDMARHDGAEFLPEIGLSRKIYLTI